jgi:hypothetical protein
MNMLPSQRFDTGRALTEDQLRAMVPSVFATTAHESRSERFAPIPTIEVIRRLAAEGFSVVGARQARAKSDDRREYCKHLLRIRQLDRQVSVGDTIFVMLLKNANDGSSIYDLFAGLFRVACLNGMVVDEKTIASIKVRHTGDVVSKVIEGTFEVMKQGEAALEYPQAWSRIQLQNTEALAFAEQAHFLRFADSNGVVSTPVKPEQLLARRRPSDTKSDLWTTFNVVQENAVRGGVTGVGRNAVNQVIRRTTRPINGIDQDVKLNRALWQLGEKMAELKAA